MSVRDLIPWNRNDGNQVPSVILPELAAGKSPVHGSY